MDGSAQGRVSPLLCSPVSKLIKIGLPEMAVSECSAKLSLRRMFARVGPEGDA